MSPTTRFTLSNCMLLSDSWQSISVEPSLQCAFMHSLHCESRCIYIYIHNGHSWQCSFLANLCSFESTFVKKTALPKLAVQQLHPAGKPDQLTKYVKKIRES